MSLFKRDKRSPSLERQIQRFLLSRATILFLIGSVGVSCLIGSLTPQMGRKGPRFFAAWQAESPRVYFLVDLLQLNHIYTSIWFLILIAVVALSLSYSIYYQTKGLIEFKTGAPGSFESSFSISVSKTAPGFAAKIRQAFQGAGYRPCLPGGGEDLIFEKNRWARWGSVIFHLGLFCIIIAAIYGLAFQKRGYVHLARGDTFSGRDQDLIARDCGVLAAVFDLGFRVRLNDFAPAYWETDQIKELSSGLTLFDKDREMKYVLSMGKPVRFKGIDIYQSFDYGYVLTFVLESKGAEPVVSHFFLDAPGRKDKPFTGGFVGESATDYTLDMKFYPNLIEPSFYVTLPGVDLIVKKNGKVEFDGRVLFSQQARVANGDTFTFVGINYWSALSFVKNYGIPFVYLGLLLSVTGAFLIYVFPYKRVYLKIREDSDSFQIAMGGRANRYQAIFSEELKEIGARLKKMLKV